MCMIPGSCFSRGYSLIMMSVYGVSRETPQMKYRGSDLSTINRLVGRARLTIRGMYCLYVVCACVRLVRVAKGHQNCSHYRFIIFFI